MLPLLQGLPALLLHHPQDPIFLKLTISHVSRRPNGDRGPRHGRRGKEGHHHPPPASSSWRFHQGNKRLGIRDTMLPIQVSLAAPGPQLPLLQGDL